MSCMLNHFHSGSKLKSTDTHHSSNSPLVFSPNCVTEYFVLVNPAAHPQVELHVHLDGAIRLQTILDVAR